MTWPVACASLLLGFAVAQVTGVRSLGAIVLVAGCAWCGLRWLRVAGVARTALLVAIYVGAFVLSHVVADALGAWPSVLLAAAATGVAAYLLADRAEVADGADGGAGVSPARARP